MDDVEDLKAGSAIHVRCVPGRRAPLFSSDDLLKVRAEDWVETLQKNGDLLRAYAQTPFGQLLGKALTNAAKSIATCMAVPEKAER